MSAPSHPMLSELRIILTYAVIGSVLGIVGGLVICYWSVK